MRGVGCGRRRARLARAGVALALWQIASVIARAEDVAILKNRNVAPYQMAAKGAMARLSGVTVLSIDLPDKPDPRDISAAITSTRARVILAVGHNATLIARGLGLPLPIVSCMLLDPSDSAAKPTIPGVHLQVSAAAQLGAFRSLTGRLHTVAILYDPARSEAIVKEAESAARSVGVAILRVPVKDASDVFPALRGIKKQGGDGLWMIPDATVYNKDSMEGILRSTIENRLPFMAADKEGVRQGALLALSPEFDKVGAQAADMVSAILAGKSPGELTLEPPRDFGLYVNEKTAALLELSLDPDVLKGAVQSFK